MGGAWQVNVSVTPQGAAAPSVASFSFNATY
jgi:hypothetical protein